MFNRRKFEGIIIRAKMIRRCIQMADKAKTMKEREDWAMHLISGDIRADDDLFVLIEEIARLRKWPLT